MSLAPGDVLDRFTIVARLGSGGMGEVYRARDNHLQREVALKVLRDDAEHADRAAVSELLREARAAVAMQHPNVVAVYDVAQAASPDAMAGTAYMTMELIDGLSLRERIQEGTIDLDTRVRWLREVALALGHAHQRGLVHRDVKPANIMISGSGQVKVLDFGIARKSGVRNDPTAATRSTSTVSTAASRSTAGTPAYMAPEQLRGEPVDGRADQFAWGVTAYEVLCGARPWASEADAMHLAAEILSRQPATPRSRNAAVPTFVSDVLMRALAKAPEERFASMEALVAALDGEVPATEIAAAAAPTVPGAPLRRGPTRMLVASALLVLALLGVAALLLAPSPQPGEGTPAAAVAPPLVSAPVVTAAPAPAPAPSAAPAPIAPPKPKAKRPSSPPLFYP